MDMEKQIAELQAQVNYLLQTLAVQDQELAVPKAVAQVPMDGDVLWSDNPVDENSIVLPWFCGYTLSGNKVTLGAGYVFWGIKVISVAALADQTVVDDDCWGLVVTFSESAWTAAWTKYATVAAFVDTEEVIKKFYYQFGLSGGVASIKHVGAMGNWNIPSVFAPE